VFRGDTESAEFSRQSDSIALVLRAAGRLARHEVVVGKSHFSVILDLADPASALARTALSLMGLRG
jgi:hypothetical protein